MSVTEPSIGARTAAGILNWSQKREVSVCSRSMRSRLTTVSDNNPNRTHAADERTWTVTRTKLS
jgi:hypothetical protein